MALKTAWKGESYTFSSDSILPCLGFGGNAVESRKIGVPHDTSAEEERIFYADERRGISALVQYRNFVQMRMGMMM